MSSPGHIEGKLEKRQSRSSIPPHCRNSKLKEKIDQIAALLESKHINFVYSRPSKNGKNILLAKEVEKYDFQLCLEHIIYVSCLTIFKINTLKFKKL